MPPELSPKPSLEDACDTDEIFHLAYWLAVWGLKNGECDEHDAVGWVLDHPHDAQLPRGSKGRLNPTRHHITQGARRAVDRFIPGLRTASFDPGPLHELAARVDGSGVTHERYLLGVIALCFEKKTLSPVITGPMLARVVGVAEPVAGKVLRKWSTTLAYGFFTNVAYDGERGHGRVWTVDPDWAPTSKPKHADKCQRGTRCNCGVMQNGLSILSAAKDRSPKVHQFRTWVESLKPRTPLTVGDVARELGVTRHAATKLLRSEQGGLLSDGTWDGGRVRKRGADGKRRWVQQGRTWFTRDAPVDLTYIDAAKAKHAADMAGESACPFRVGMGTDERPCGVIAPPGQYHCPEHEAAIVAYQAHQPN